jgi:GTPase
MNKQKNKLPIVVICGRTNVGKSTLFNRLVEKNQALISKLDGTTRDANIDEVSWNRCLFTLIDTAGLITPKLLEKIKIKKIDSNIDTQAQIQALSYLKEADIIIFLVDTKAGLLPEDKQLAKAINKRKDIKNKVLLVANKVDGQRQRGEVAQFNKLGLSEPISLSAQTGSGTGDLLDIITEKLPKNEKIKEKEDVDKIDREEIKKEIKLCIIGKPNVGKSSLLNAMLGYERVIVNEKAHTTREPQDTKIIYQEKNIRLVDTAGISRHGHKAKGLERPGIAKSLVALNRADIALLVFDISQDLTHQDAKIVEEILKRQKSLIFIANKWDVVEDRDRKKWTQYIYQEMPFATWAPIVFISAKNKGKIDTVLDTALPIAEARKKIISDTQLKKFLARVVKIHKPVKAKGTKLPHIFDIKQKKAQSPVFIVRIGSKDNLHFSYIRFLKNRLREQFDFIGTPIKIIIENNKKIHGQAS